MCFYFLVVYPRKQLGAVIMHELLSRLLSSVLKFIVAYTWYSVQELMVRKRVVRKTSW